MKLNDLQTGDIFTIDETPSYPKLKTDYGYIDMRDELKIESAMLNRKLSIRIMSFQDVVDEMRKLHKNVNREQPSNEEYLRMVEKWRERLLSL